MRKLIGSTWGADENILNKLYTGYVKSAPEYGIAASATAVKSNSD